MVNYVETTESTITNTTYVLNLCAPLGEDSNRDDMSCGADKNSMFILLSFLSLPC